MQASEYARMHAVEDRMWWYRGLHRILLASLSGPSLHRVLDAGCGTGGLLRRLREYRPELAAVGLDADATAAGLASAKAGRPVTAASINALPFPAESFDAVVSADVLSHDLVDLDAALAEIHRCLRPRGRVVLNLPAYRWMLSAHDHVTNQSRRFTAADAVAMLRAAGFRDIRSGYWNTILFPMMVLRRKLFPPRNGSDVALFPGPIDWLFSRIVLAEAALIRIGVRWPFGGSVLVIGVKP